MKKRKKISKSRKAKIFRRRRILALILLLAIIFSTTLLIKTIYIKVKCKNFDYSVNYYLTNNSSNEELMRVQNFSLTFYDTDLAIVKANGLKKEAPHKYLTVEGRFVKDKFGSWTLENTYLLENQ